MLLDEDGKDVGHPPIELKNQCSADRAHLHQGCDGLGLFHETAVTSVMAIGSARDFQGQQRLKEFYLAAGWHPVPYVPDIDIENKEGEDEDENSRKEASEVEDENESDDGDNKPSGEPEEEQEQEWDITGHREVKCPCMAGRFGRYAPYTLETFSSQHRVRVDIWRFRFRARGI
jgi:hypothetical protein